MKLTHWGISYFRSIGEKPVMLDLTKKINVLVGANNSGKSNVLRGLEWYGSKSRKMEETDWFNRSRSNAPLFSLMGKIDNDDSTLKKLGMLEVKYDSTSPSNAIRGTTNLETLGWLTFTHVFFRDLNQHISSQHSREDETQHMVRYALKKLNEEEFRTKKIGFIPVFREIKSGDTYSIGGQGVIRLLAQWHHPRIGREADNKKFEHVQSLLRRLLNMPDVAIEVPPETPDTILVRRGDLRLPLDSYGTGIHQLIILAIAVLSFDNAIVCIEEPEIHLHPLLQRRFIQFLREETKNNYVITTHSPALIASDSDTAVTHLRLDENRVTESRPITTSADTLRALEDLGAQASDLLQANSVIWVEGPSDRIYLNRWLELLHPGRPELLHPGRYREGIDYTVMFYGGRLLSHLSMERDLVAETKEDEGAELIQLLKINQHSAILIDSDHKKKGAPLNDTKQRIKEQCDRSKVFCWITPGREIENSVPVAAIEATYADFAKTPVTVKLRPYQKLEDALKSSLTPVWKRAHYYEHAKAQLAHEISAKMVVDQLSQEVRDLVAGIVNVIEHKLR